MSIPEKEKKTRRKRKKRNPFFLLKRIDCISNFTLLLEKIFFIISIIGWLRCDFCPYCALSTNY